MYLRRHRREKNGTIYEYWSLVKSVRTERGPRQRTVAFIGKEPGKEFEREMLEENWTRIESGVEVKLCAAPDGTEETYVLCRSAGRQEKERAILNRQVQAMEEGLNKIAIATTRPKRTLRNRSTADRRVGRLLQRYPKAAKLFTVTIEEGPDPHDASKTRLNVEYLRNTDRDKWAELANGCYLLRTNMKADNPVELWETYIGLTQVEYSFRLGKSDLLIRPVHHRLDHRAQAHILICFIALAMWRTLEMWMKASGLGTCPRKLAEEMGEVKSMDVVLPCAQRSKMRLRVVSKPEKRLAELLDRLRFPLPNRPKTIPNVVQTFGTKSVKSSGNSATVHA